MRVSLVLLLLTALLTFPIITAAGGPSPQVGEPQGKIDKPAVKEDKTWVDVKKAKPVEPDKENLEKNKDIVKVYNEYWKAISEKDYKKAYSMESVDFRKKVSYDLYVEHFKNAFIIKHVQPIKVTHHSEKEVIVRGLMRYQLILATDRMDTIRTFDDKWVREDSILVHIKEKSKDVKN